MIRYSVACRFSSVDPDLPGKWINWLKNGHIAQVIACGGRSAEIIELDDSVPHFEIRYSFNSREELDAYLANHAPRLRAEGLDQFPIDLGLEFKRTVGKVVYVTN